ncbi:MAG: exodeoxyribonuclease VII large subunit [Halanaerobiaceae bacterium]
MDKKIYSITDLTKYLKKLLSADPVANDLWVSGEISNFHHHSSGHMYFTLKDDNSCLSSIMFRGNNRTLKFEPEDGMKVNAHGYISIYEPRGSYQFYVDSLEPAGKGALYQVYEQLKEKLEKEGLFSDEHKKDIPMLPRKIGIVTSATGAAIRDILSVVNRRFSNVYVLIVPSLVQGKDAGRQIVKGIEYLNSREDIDLIIISRGGGSIEDLWPFNEEIVARAIYESKVPLISGVGHETDFTIADFVADLRAPTPSAAAELAISSRIELENNISNYYTRLINAVKNRTEFYRNRIDNISEKRIFTNPQGLFSEQAQKLDDLGRRVEWQMEKVLSKSREKFNILNGKLDSLSPLKTLARGYSITYKEGEVADDIYQIKIGDEIQTRLENGELRARVFEVNEEDYNG